MKLVLVCNNNLFLFPFLKKYLSVFTDSVEYRIVFWNRNEPCCSCADNKYIQYVGNGKFILKKIINYFRFILFARRIITKERPDYVIAFNTQTAIFLFRFLLRKKIPYIFDFRDESHERNALYRSVVEKCIRKSALTVVSSLGFLSLFKKIDNKRIVLCHNNKFDHLLNSNRVGDTKIRLSFWGMIRHESYFEKLISVLGNDDRFLIFFYGKNDSRIKEYACLKQYSNVVFKGPYSDNQIVSILSNTDIAINAYPNDSVQKHSLTCKMYESISASLPMIVQKGSYMQFFLSGRGYPVFLYNYDNFTADDLYQWFHNVDAQSLNNSSMKILEEVKKDNLLFFEALETTLGLKL